MEDRGFSFDVLEALLTRLGFECVPVEGDQLVFTHKDSGALIILPPRKWIDPVDKVHSVAVRRTLVENGLIEADEFDWIVARERFGNAATAPSRP
jgi:hypothetical protein